MRRSLKFASCLALLCSACSSFHSVVSDGDTAAASTALEAGQDPDELLLKKQSVCPGNRAGVTALVLAAQKLDVEMVRLLLEEGANPNKKSCGLRYFPCDGRFCKQKGAPTLGEIWASPIEMVMLTAGGLTLVQNAQDAFPGHFQGPPPPPWPKVEELVHLLMEHGADVRGPSWTLEPYVDPRTVEDVPETRRLAELLLGRGAEVVSRRSSAKSELLLAAGVLVAGAALTNAAATDGSAESEDLAASAQGEAACVQDVHAHKPLDRQVSDSWDGTDTTCVKFTCRGSNVPKTRCEKPDGTWHGGETLEEALRDACDCD